ncbi:MAG: PfkB family carbohydrate kinase [Rhodobacteraceae bacterium]|nr:PfkB family carbohydrate kinase [Paracoccaceae bacterium]
MSHALFIGRSVLDVTALVQDFPGPDGKARALANDVIPGGSALNAAVVFAHLGGKAVLATSLGAPGLFREYVNIDLARRGVVVEDVCADPDYRLPLSTVVSTRSLGTRMIVNGAGEECRRLLERHELFSAGHRLIQLDQYERHFVRRHCDEIRAFNGPVVLDGGGWKEWSPEFLALTDMPIVSEVFCEKGPRVFASMCSDLGIERWAITQGAKGVIWRDGADEGRIPAKKVDCVDSLGAGDIFHGAFCHAYLQTRDFVEALNRANLIAARSCEMAGTRSWMDG